MTRRYTDVSSETKDIPFGRILFFFILQQTFISVSEKFVLYYRTKKRRILVIQIGTNLFIQELRPHFLLRGPLRTVYIYSISIRTSSNFRSPVCMPRIKSHIVNRSSEYEARTSHENFQAQMLKEDNTELQNTRKRQTQRNFHKLSQLQTSFILKSTYPQLNLIK